MSGDQQQNDLVNLLVQNLERTSVEDGSIPSSVGHSGGNTNNTRKHPKSRKHGGHDQRNQHRLDKDDILNGYNQFGIPGNQYIHGSNVSQDMQGRDREWAEYVQIMNLPVSGIHARGDTQAAQPPQAMPLSYMTGTSISTVDEEGIYNEQDEAHFVQSFVQSPQFLPYQFPGYFQHPGFTSQLYSDGRVFTPNQPYPFGAQQYMVAPENFQDQVAALQTNYSYSKVAQQQNNGGHQDKAEDKERTNGSAVLYNTHSMGVNSVHDPAIDPRSKQKKKSGPKSWADIANSPAAKNPVQRPKQQPQQILTKQTAKPEDKQKQVQPAQKKSDVPTKAEAPPKNMPNLDHINTTPVDLNPSHARFFVIKSYSEDDIHKAIKYNIWASTDSGNRRLDTAFKESGSKGPIYLFFSVNASGQFCGMAQMMTALDYEKKCDLWAQDKWNGQFQLKWIFIKDIPNSQLRHIRLENNDNKPVTNSRDTQEVLFEPGKEMLRIFTTYKAKSSILDDFSFYDKRQELMKEKKLQSPSNDDEPEAELPTGSNRTKARINKKGNE